MKSITCIIPQCENKVKARKLCGKHYKRWYKYGSPYIALLEQSPKGKPLAFLFDAIRKAEDGYNDCITWPYGIVSGYGKVCFQGKDWYAHRLALHIFTDTWDTPLHAIHLPVVCHEPSCVNPNHLRWGTHSENMLDRNLDGTGIRGAKHPRAKLTEKQVKAIRADNRLQRLIADTYGVNQRYISDIKNGKIWKEA